jgi:hypothetical protein
MGFFDLFNKNNKNDTEKILIGYFRTETSKLIGHEVNSPKYKTMCESAGEMMQKTLVPLLNKEQQQTVYETIKSACPTRVNEAFGEYMVLLFTRYAVIQKAVSEGRVKANEASLEIIVDALHKQVKKLVSRD